MHDLTLKGVREMLSTENFFIKKLLSLALPGRAGKVSFGDLRAEETLAKGLSSLLLLDVFQAVLDFSL